MPHARAEKNKRDEEPMKRYLIALITFALLAAGCLQIDTHVKLNEDGSATITEKLRFSRRLLDLEDKADAKLKPSRFLTKAAVLERMKHMGKGIRLVSHKVVNVEKGAKESVAVYHIPDLNDLRYLSPFPSYADYAKNNTIRIRCYPLYKSESYVGGAGEMAVVFWPTKNPRREARPEKGKPAPKAPTPMELQTYRELRPVFRDILRDFKVRLRFESYAPIRATGFGHRGRRAGVNYCDLIDFSDDDLDNHGGTFLENQEIMIDLLRWKLGSANVVNHTRGYAGNLTLPVYLPWGSKHCPWRGSSGIFFKPSLPLFNRHFKGKKLDYSRWRANPPNKHVPARFDRIGYKKETVSASKSK
jgi:hypothetical protein